MLNVVQPVFEQVRDDGANSHNDRLQERQRYKNGAIPLFKRILQALAERSLAHNKKATAFTVAFAPPLGLEPRTP
jgi:hypothetical protein